MSRRTPIALRLYKCGMRAAGPVLRRVLSRRQRGGKESPARLSERRGRPGLDRPRGKLVWVHAASVGEAQSALALVRALRDRDRLAVLVTTGTLSSARMLETTLPAGAFHQFYPLDHPVWVERFLDHWRPDLICWMESELWPNMLMAVGARHIPALLLNARMSGPSYKRWALLGGAARRILQSFTHILCQTADDAALYRRLGAAGPVTITGNLKYDARALDVNDADLRALNAALGTRPRWVYASTHAGEERLAARLHARLQTALPGLITIIVPRHPERRGEIAGDLAKLPLNVLLRGDGKKLPGEETDIYLADTMGELGLFYRVSPVAVIGRSFSDDGGGGHNPIEAAQLACAVLHGPNVQNLEEIFAQMNAAGAAFRAGDEAALAGRLQALLSDEALRAKSRQAACEFAKKQAKVLGGVFEILRPHLEKLTTDEAAT